MLSLLQIRNFVIIDAVGVEFAPGFNVLTGETGAGKSIIIDAIDLILGGRARPDLIRHGCDESTVEALFSGSAVAELADEIVEAGLEPNSDELLVRRIVSRTGKNRIFINGCVATASQLQSITSRLVAIYGQHEQFSLAKPETHGQLLDNFAGLAEQVGVYQTAYRRLEAIDREITALDKAADDRLARLDLISYQRNEIDRAMLQLGEEDDLAAERTRLQHAGRLAAAAHAAYEQIYGEDDACCSRLAPIRHRLDELTGIEPAFAPLCEQLRSAELILEDSALQLRDYGSKVQDDPQRLEAVENRITLISSLKRKYGNSIADILEYCEKISAECGRLEDLDGTRSDLMRQRGEAATLFEQAAAALSAERQRAAPQLAARVEDELKSLAMQGARFLVDLQPLSTPSATGLERTEFLLAANTGEPPKPLAKVASGGELSRLMLALRRACPESDSLTTLIFDEVDAGIGGIAATAVGERLQAVATDRQVLCITHLPQVAAFANRHFKVEKSAADGDRTVAAITELQDPDRVDEIARMLGGAKITGQTLAHARELLILSGTTAY